MHIARLSRKLGGTHQESRHESRLAVKTACPTNVSVFIRVYSCPFVAFKNFRYSAAARSEAWATDPAGARIRSRRTTWPAQPPRSARDTRRRPAERAEPHCSQTRTARFPAKRPQHRGGTGPRHRGIAGLSPVLRGHRDTPGRPEPAG